MRRPSAHRFPTDSTFHPSKMRIQKARLRLASAERLRQRSSARKETLMPAFENGWICRHCWCSNREFDGRCYRCHADRDPAFHSAESRPIAQASAPAPEAEPRPVVSHLLTEAPTKSLSGAAVTSPVGRRPGTCGSCQQPLAGDELFCTRCGAPTEPSGVSAKPEEPFRAATPVGAARTVRLPNPAESARRGYQLIVAKLSSALVTLARPVQAAARFYQWGTDRIQRTRDAVRTVRQHGQVVLFVAWVVLMTLAALLFSGLGEDASFGGGGRAFASMAMVLTVGAFSAVTASLTILMLGGRLSARDQQGQPRALDDARGATAARADHPAR
jgi:hypothetical protein